MRQRPRKFLRFAFPSLALISAAIISGCSFSLPEVRPAGDLAFDSLTEKAELEQERQYAKELRALTRKGEILDRIHQFQPYIKVVNVYLPPKQLQSGTYSHAQVVSVPLIFRQDAIRLSADASELAVQTPPSAAAPTTASPTPTSPPTVFPASTPLPLAAASTTSSSTPTTAPATSSIRQIQLR